MRRAKQTSRLALAVTFCAIAFAPLACTPSVGRTVAPIAIGVIIEAVIEGVASSPAMSSLWSTLSGRERPDSILTASVAGAIAEELRSSEAGDVTVVVSCFEYEDESACRLRVSAEVRSYVRSRLARFDGTWRTCRDELDASGALHELGFPLQVERITDCMRERGEAPMLDAVALGAFGGNP